MWYMPTPPSFTGISWMKNKFLISPVVCSISQLHVNEYISLQYQSNIKWKSDKKKRFIRWSSTKFSELLWYEFMADSKENFLGDFGSERFKRFKRNGVQVNQMVHEANISRFHIDGRTPLQVVTKLIFTFPKIGIF